MGNTHQQRCTKCNKKTAAYIDVAGRAFCSATCRKVWEREHPPKPAPQHEPCHSESMTSG